MNKLTQLRRKVIIEAVIILGIASATAGLAFFFHSGLKKERVSYASYQSQMHSIGSKIATLEEKYDFARSSLELYNELNKELLAGRYDTNRNDAQEILNRLRKKYRINNLSVRFGEAITSSGDGSTDNTSSMEIISRDINLTFDALSDLHVFSFLKAIEKEMPGFLSYASVSVTRQRQLTRDALLEISEGKEPRIVNAEIVYNWQGIQKKGKATDEAPAAGGPVP